MVSGGATVDDLLNAVRLVETGEKLGNIDQLHFRDPDSFVSGQLHKHYEHWVKLAQEVPFDNAPEVLTRIRQKVSTMGWLVFRL